MSDIEAQLRCACDWCGLTECSQCEELRIAAADEIARLRAALQQYADHHNWIPSEYGPDNQPSGEFCDLWNELEHGWTVAEKALKGDEQ